MNAVKSAILAVGLMLSSGITTQAVDTEGWSFEITPYLWYAGLEGDIKVNGQKF